MKIHITSMITQPEPSPQPFVAFIFALVAAASLTAGTAALLHMLAR